MEEILTLDRYWERERELFFSEGVSTGRFPVLQWTPQSSSHRQNQLDLLNKYKKREKDMNFGRGLKKELERGRERWVSKISLLYEYEILSE